MGGGTSLMTLSSEKCPSDTVKWPYELFIGLLFGGNDKELMILLRVLSSLL